MKRQVWILHGWALGPDNDDKWQPFISEIKKSGIECNFINLPGLDFEIDRPWDLDDYVNWLLSQLPQVPIVLLGHSFGGQLAVRFASRHPSRVDKLILIGPSGIIDNSLRKILKRKVFSYVAKTGKLLSKSEFFRSLLYRLAGEKDYFQAKGYLKETMRSLIGTDIRNEIDRIKASTLLLWGENDQASPFRFHREYKKRIKNLEFHPIKGARHSPQFTHKEVTSAYVSKFIRDGE